MIRSFLLCSIAIGSLIIRNVRSFSFKNNDDIPSFPYPKEREKRKLNDLLGDRRILADEEVKLVVQTKNKEGKDFVKSHSTTFLEEEELAYMGIVALKSEVELINNNPNIESLDIDYDMHLFQKPVSRRLSPIDLPDEMIDWGVIKVLQDMDFWDNLPNPMPIAEPMKICVADTGYELGHEDLPEDPSDVSGTNNYGEDWSYDGNGHGTHCAGVVGAIGNNDK